MYLAFSVTPSDSIEILLLIVFQSMLKVFERFGFGGDFVRWVPVLRRDAKSCVSYCGWLSDLFAVESRV